MRVKPSVLGTVFGTGLVLASSGCLSVLDAGTQNDGGVVAGTSAGTGSKGTASGGIATGGSTSASAAGGGSSTGAIGIGSTTGFGSTSAGGSTTGIPPCTYPVSTQGGLQQFPNAALGDGWLNQSGSVDQSSGLSVETNILTQLHCAGLRYALIDVSAVWASQSQDLAVSTPQFVPGWLEAGGVALTVLEQGADASNSATDQDLTTWASTYQINYSLVNDPQETLGSELQIKVLPSVYIVRLYDMAVVYSFQGSGGAVNGVLSMLLAGDGGTQ